MVLCVAIRRHPASVKYPHGQVQIAVLPVRLEYPASGQLHKSGRAVRFHAVFLWPFSGCFVEVIFVAVDDERVVAGYDYIGIRLCRYVKLACGVGIPFAGTIFDKHHALHLPIAMYLYGIVVGLSYVNACALNPPVLRFCTTPAPLSTEEVIAGEEPTKATGKYSNGALPL